MQNNTTKKLMETKQTAVELLAILIYSDCQFGGTLDNRISIDTNYLEEIIEQAKAMEKEQIKSDFHNSVVAMAMGRIMTPEQYYNETYGSQAPQRLSQANGTQIPKE